MKKGQICEGYVERLDFPNKGILSCEDEKIVVKCTARTKNIFHDNQKTKG